MSRLLKLLMIAGLAASFCLLTTEPAGAASGPFTCSSNFYQVISGQLKLLNPVTGQYTDIGSNPGFDYNAIGYNTLDNYIYGIIETGPNFGDLIRVASDGTTTDLGLPAGLPQANNDYAGDFDLAGNLYLVTFSSAVYKINVVSNIATQISVSGDPLVAASDLVFINNNLYLLEGSTLSVVNLNTDIVTNSTVTGPSGWLNAGNSFGAGWADNSGNLFFSNNNSGVIYQISNYDTASPTASFKVNGTVTSINDGANCHLAKQNPFDPPVATNDSYTVQFNTPLNEITTPLLSNDVGNGLNVTSNTTPAHGKVSVNSDGTFTYTPDADFSGVDSFSYTVTDSVGRTSSATVSITVLPTNVVSPVVSPNTGDGTPNQSNPKVFVLTLAGLLLTGGGLWFLYHQTYYKARRYRL